MADFLFRALTFSQYLNTHPLIRDEYILFPDEFITVRNEVAKVMFLQASVCPQGGGWGVCLSACWDTTPPGADTPPPGADTPPPGADTPPEQTHPYPRADTPLPQSRHTPTPEQTPPQSRHTPLSRHLPPGADTHPPPRDTATAADGMHPTGMHSRFQFTCPDGQVKILDRSLIQYLFYFSG